MKNNLLHIIVVMMCLIGLSLNAQNKKDETHSIVADSEQYQQLKMAGKLNKVLSSGTVISNPDNSLSKGNGRTIANDGQNPPMQTYSSSCWGYTAPNPGAIPVLGNVDDQGYGPIALPFNFCFYGTNYNACYINSNGNVTFTQAFTTFTATAFPSATIPPMLAPFWGDVDNRGSGACYYEILPNAAIFHWVAAGYFNQHTDKLNTFQLIISDFTSPLLQPGNNVGFFYNDMNWTTGDASSGVNGYGGTPATVGVNEGNGLDYIQIGRFDGPGNFYDGPFNQSDSVDWLDHKTFMFDVCNSVNLPPIVAGIDFCDTLKLCVGDTLPIDVSFLAPEVNQTTWASVDTSQASGFQVISNTSGTGSSCQISAEFIGTVSNVGVNVVTFTAYDNGIPADTIQLDYIILVDSIPTFPVIAGDTSYCLGGNVELSLEDNFDTYLWSTGDTASTIFVTQGTYTVYTTIDGCGALAIPIEINEFPSPFIEITGDTIFCPGDSVLLNATQGYDAYLWNTGANDTLDSIYVTQGSYSVTVTDSNGCVGVSNVHDVVNFSSTLNIIGDTTYCIGDSVLLDAGAGFDTYLWSNGDTTQTTFVTQGTHSVSITAYGCLTSDTQTVVLINVPVPVIIGDTAYCQGDSVLLDAGAGYDAYLWNSSETTQSISVTQGVASVMVTLDGCNAFSSPFTVIENSLPSPVVTGNLHYCALDSAGTTLSTVNGYNQYSWSTGDTTASIYAVASPPSYAVTVVDQNGCEGTSASVLVTSSSPANNITGVVDFCLGEYIAISADQGFSSYLWSNGETSSTVNLTEGTYGVTVTDMFGCTDVDSITLVAKPAPVANFSISPTAHGETNEPVIFTDLSTVSSGSITDWTWIFDYTNIGVANPAYEFTQGPHSVLYDNQGTHTIWLEVVSNFNCRDTVQFEYLIVDDVIVPNVFTPNNDGQNDFLIFKNITYQIPNHVEIYDRWGRKIFEQENYNNDWDGGGHSEGTYFFIITLPDSPPIKGSVTLLK